jgi:hypothetical protein
MAPIDDIDTGQETRYETPSFDPRGAFAWTLRSGEIALRQCRQGQSRLPHRDELTSIEPDAARPVGGTRPDGSAAECYVTPTFDPRSAFARTLRAGEVARIARGLRQANPSPGTSSRSAFAGSC